MKIPPRNLSPEATPWAAYVERAITDLQTEAERRAQGELNANKSQSGSLATLASNIVDLEGRLTDAIAGLTFPASAIVSGEFSPDRIPDIDQGTVTGTWSKAVNTASSITGGSVSATNVTGGNVFAQSLATLITATRVALWGRTSDGYIATASSSERYKTNIRPSDIDPLAVLSIEPVYYQWIEQAQERERRASLPKNDPEYAADLHIATEVGMIAERLHEAGLWEFVVYQREAVYETTIGEDGSESKVLAGERLVLDKEGNPIPDGIHYINWGVALQVVARYLHAEQQALKETVADLSARLEAAGL